MSLAPEIRAYLEAGAAAGLPQVWEAPIEVIRGYRQSQLAFSGPVEKVTEVVNRYIPGPTADLPIRIYRPTTDAKAPAIIYLHGGGWVLNFLDIYDASLSRLANQTGATIISVHYQKAPEHPFPIPFDDCYATLLWAIKNAEALQIDKKELVWQVIAPAEIWHRRLHSKRAIMELSWHSNSLSTQPMIATLTLPPIKNMPPALGSQHRLWNGSGINTCKVMRMIKTHMRFRREQQIFRTRSRHLHHGAI